MTSVAIFSEAPAVNVVSAMAVGAVVSQVDLSGDRSAVAGLAGELHMRAIERKIGLSAVVEPPEVPPVRVVAQTAPGAEPAAMFVVLRVAISTGQGGALERRRGVALLADGDGMLADQREPGQIMVEENLDQPAPFVMATGAFRAFLALVSVILSVAIDARGAEFLFLELTLMARGAVELGVLVAKRELGVLVVIESDLLPARRAVTILALYAVAAFVFVVFLVTGDTGLLELLPVQIAGMAGLAGSFRVAPLESELGVLPVIESDTPPVLGPMAVVAFGAVTAVVNVIQSMAGHAIDRRVLVSLAGVASGAGHFPMLTDQGKLGLGAVVEFRFGPIGLGVTIGASGAQPTPVRFIGPMAIDAPGRRLAVSLVGFVASGAGGLGVGPLQEEVGAAVIEGVFVQPDNVFPPAFMVRMAAFAFGLPDPLDSPVVAGPGVDVGRDLFVTG